MKFGYYVDNELPRAENPGYDTNSYGYRCKEFFPLPDGGKNVAVLGCSHTFGEGLEEHEVWVSQLAKLVSGNLRFWNLGQPGASPDKCVRILYGCEKVLFPKIIIMCWPAISRRERLDTQIINLTSDDMSLKHENETTDLYNFLKCVFQTEKFAEYNKAKIFHCFAQDPMDIKDAAYVMSNKSIRTCWPVWSKIKNEKEKRMIIDRPSVAKDGLHYGIEHHRTFAELFYNKFRSKLK